MHEAHQHQQHSTPTSGAAHSHALAHHGAQGHAAHQHHGPAHGHSAGHGHSHAQHGHEAPATEGRVMRGARFYDLRVSLMMLGQLQIFRTQSIELANLKPGERVLDVGCGTGDLALAAARIVGTSGAAYGIDASPEMIAEARRKMAKQKHQAEFSAGVVELLDFPDAFFDVVFSSLMMHHLTPDLRRRALAEIRRVLRPGGRLVLVDLQIPTRLPRFWEPGWLITRLHKMHTHPEGVARTGSDALAILLGEAGFASVEKGTTRYPWVGYARGRVPV